MPTEAGQAAAQTFLLLQLTDPLLPIGSYAHSYGLETCIQRGSVRDAPGARLYLEEKLRLSFLYGDLLPARLAWEATRRGDRTALRELDDLLSASRAPQELREAGWKLGSRFLKTVEGMIGALPEPAAALLAGGRSSYPVCFGSVCAALDLPEADSLSHFLYSQVSAMVTCCVKSIPLRQTDGQQILCSLHPLMAQLLQTCMVSGADELCLAAPGFDLDCMEHETLYSRLYMS